MVTERKKVEERLRRKQAEVAGLEEKLRAAKIYVAALKDVMKIYSGEEQFSDGGKLRPGSAVAQAREAILARGVPVHLDELIVAIGKPLTQSTKSSLVGSLAAYVRQSEIFTRTAPNTFGLLELGHDADDEERNDEPPAGFGRDSVEPDILELEDDVPF